MTSASLAIEDELDVKPDINRLNQDMEAYNNTVSPLSSTAPEAEDDPPDVKPDISMLKKEMEATEASDGSIAPHLCVSVVMKEEEPPADSSSLNGQEPRDIGGSERDKSSPTSSGVPRGVSASSRHVCGVCSQVFGDHSALMRHSSEIHADNNKPYACLDCGKRFHRRPRLLEHRRTHTGEKPYKCAHCDNRFADDRSLKSHQRIHTGETPYGCEECGMSFRSQRALVSHVRIHAGSERYRCDDCGKEFVDRIMLVNHCRYLHGGVRADYLERNDNAESSSDAAPPARRRLEKADMQPYKCDECEMTFPLRSHLINHRRKHRDVRPYACDRCGEQVRTMHELRRHVERTHSTRGRFTCDQCGKTFTERLYFLRHCTLHNLLGSPAATGAE